MAGVNGAEDNNVRTTFVPGVIEHDEAAKETIRSIESLSQNVAYVVNIGYNQAVILGDTKVFRVDKVDYGIFNVFLKNEQTRKKDWRINIQRPISARNWRLVNNAMKNLTTHQEVDPDEWSRKYEAITEGTKGKRRMIFHFWFSLAIVNLEKKFTDRNEDYLEIVIDMKFHRKLTTGWSLTQKTSLRNSQCWHKGDR